MNDRSKQVYIKLVPRDSDEETEFVDHSKETGEVLDPYNNPEEDWGETFSETE